MLPVGAAGLVTLVATLLAALIALPTLIPLVALVATLRAALITLVALVASLITLVALVAALLAPLIALVALIAALLAAGRRRAVGAIQDSLRRHYPHYSVKTFEQLWLARSASAVYRAQIFPLFGNIWSLGGVS